jgi:hypothetical protein
MPPGGSMRSAIWCVLATATVIAVGAPSASAALRAETAKTTLAPGGDGSVIARCSGGRVAVSGGFGAQQKGVALVSKRKRHHAWKTEGHNFASTSRDLRAFAYCGRRRRWQPERNSKTRPIGPRGERTIRVGCASGGRPVSGGFKASDPNEIVYTSKRRGDRWEVSALGSEGDKLTGFVYCQRHAPALEAVRGQTFTFNGPGDDISLQARCPHRGEAISGGFRSTVERAGGVASVARTAASKRPNPPTWVVTGLGIGSQDSQLTAFAYCR